TTSARGYVLLLSVGSPPPGFKQPMVERGEFASCHGGTRERATACNLTDLPFWIEEIDRRVARELIPIERQFDLPVGLAAAPAVLGSLPQDANSTAEFGSGVWTNAMDDAGTMQDIDALDRRRANDLGGKPHRHASGPNDVAHERLPHGTLARRAKLGILGKSGHGLIERAVQIEENA